jgi:hypothetical protein
MSILGVTPKAMQQHAIGIMFVLLMVLACQPSHAAAIKVNAVTIAGTLQDLEKVPVELTEREEAEIDSMVLPVPPNWIGDLDGMRKRHACS